jgi:hypothetical protein
LLCRIFTERKFVPAYIFPHFLLSGIFSERIIPFSGMH